MQKYSASARCFSPLAFVPLLLIMLAGCSTPSYGPRPQVPERTDKTSENSLRCDGRVAIENKTGEVHITGFEKTFDRERTDKAVIAVSGKGPVYRVYNCASVTVEAGATVHAYGCESVVAQTGATVFIYACKELSAQAYTTVHILSCTSVSAEKSARIVEFQGVGRFTQVQDSKRKDPPAGWDVENPTGTGVPNATKPKDAPASENSGTTSKQPIPAPSQTDSPGSDPVPNFRMK